MREGSAVLGSLLALAVLLVGLVAAWAVGVGIEIAIDAVSSGGQGTWLDPGLVVSLIMLGAPLAGLLLVGERVRRRGHRRMLKGYWIGLLGGLAGLFLLIVAVDYGLDAVGIG